MTERASARITEGIEEEIPVEYETYLALKPRLLKFHEGRTVLIKDDSVVGLFDSQREAIRRGYELFGGKGFAAQVIQEEEEPVEKISNYDLE